ncbi:TPA: hypothetical protein DCE37_06145 [Candidatus Latescibacteria bacterium]|nr:hypothetical protein [Candidatus Latescibacterota bacterium]
MKLNLSRKPRTHLLFCLVVESDVESTLGEASTFVLDAYSFDDFVRLLLKTRKDNARVFTWPGLWGHSQTKR